ncbi:hypothetical protein [Nocardia wallacei]|uniref:UvrD-like helicase C-terminal domain-containing protein n=1 Tax=Nocardia wallacei TaxID=480035 RepID=A0A7G1KNY4_9NOCA|nr:hypothetical protein [Nocardia wallacei]BCK56246.1 hypothetical protein NWFMUON74_40180 [Nocardia wallacei]
MRGRDLVLVAPGARPPKVTDVGDDGSLTAVRIVKGRPGTDPVTLPADYTARHVRLGYAATIDSAQGITADICHTALRGGESRDQLYVC